MAQMRTVSGYGEEEDDVLGGALGASPDAEAGGGVGPQLRGTQVNNGFGDVLASLTSQTGQALMQRPEPGEPRDNALSGTSRGTDQPRQLAAETAPRMGADFNATGPGGYGRQPRGAASPSGGQDTESAPEQSPVPSPAQSSVFEPMPSPLNNPVTLRQLTTPAMSLGGSGLFGRAGGLQGGGLDIGRGNSGASDPTAFIEQLLASIMG